MSASQDLLDGRDLEDLLRLGRAKDSLLASLRRVDAQTFEAAPALESSHPYLPTFGCFHPLTVSEYVRQMSVGAVRTSLSVGADDGYALTRMSWRYGGGWAEGATLGRIVLRLGEREERGGKAAKMSMEATLMDGSGAARCRVELGGGFYPRAVLTDLMERAIGERLPPPARGGGRSELELIDGLHRQGDGSVRASIHASTEHPYFHHNVAAGARRHVPAALILEAGLQALVRLGGPRRPNSLDLELRRYLGFHHPDTHFRASEDGGRWSLRLWQGEVERGLLSFE